MGGSQGPLARTPHDRFPPCPTEIPFAVPLFVTIRNTAEHTTRAAASMLRQSSAWARVLLALAFVLLAGVGVLVVIPIIFIVGVVLAVLAGVVAVRAWLFREHAPNGMLDGRRNVRVRTPEGDPPSPPIP